MGEENVCQAESPFFSLSLFIFVYIYMYIFIYVISSYLRDFKGLKVRIGLSFTGEEQNQMVINMLWPQTIWLISNTRFFFFFKKGFYLNLISIFASVI